VIVIPLFVRLQNSLTIQKIVTPRPLNVNSLLTVSLEATAMDLLTHQIGQIACSAGTAIFGSVACDTMSEIRSAGYLVLAALVLLLAIGFVFRGRRI
jgi:hypothetical protein